MATKKSQNFNKFYNGIGSSEWEQNMFHTLVNVDVHTKPGAAMCSKAFARADSSIVDSVVNCRVVLPNGDILMGTENGKIFKIVANSTVSLVHTDTQGPVRGIDYLGAYVYYATDDKLGRIGLSNASSESSWSTQNDSWATFTVAGAYKHMIKQNLSLFITDGYYVASVDNTGVFSPNVLDFETTQVTTSFVKIKDYLLIGTTQGSNGDKAGGYLWDTFSPSWSDSDEVQERGINCFIDGDELIYASIGLIGNIYYWNGTSFVFLFRLQDAGELVSTGINPYGSANLNGLPLLATSRGVYSIGRAKASMPIGQVIEYVPSLGQGTEIGALVTVASRVYFGYKNGSNYGIDKITSNYATGIIKTPVVVGKQSSVTAFYSSMPDGCSLELSVKNDGGSYVSKEFKKNDTDTMAYESKMIANKAIHQSMISLIPNGATTPEIYDIAII